MVACTVDDCHKRQVALGLCSMHYARMHKHGTLDLPERPVRYCSVDDCENSYWSTGFCTKHYQQWRTKGVILPEVREKHRNNGLRCAHCDRPAKSRGLCNAHYQRLKFGRPLEAPWRGEVPKVERPCSVDECERVAKAHGLCHFHYSRQREGIALDHRTPERIISRGYARVLVAPGKRAFEHRLVIEQMLGRPLRRDENIHHINGVRDDNRLENLELWSTWQPCGQRVADKVAWARDLLALYAPEQLAHQTKVS